MEAVELTDVAIVGCGPTGAMLSTLLGQFGVKNIVLERDPEISTDPRGIALDEDGIRCLQSCGIYDKVFTEMGHCTGTLKFVSGRHTDLHKKEFLRFNYATTEGGTGHPGFMFHKQPQVEMHLRRRMAQLPASELRVSSTVLGISEDNESVHVHYSDSQGRTRQLQCTYLIGCDGKTGFTRKRYLEPRGIKLEQAHQTSYEEVWVALNWKISLPTPETHPDFPLWKKGFSPQQVYDNFFPTDFRFLCQPDRPAVCGRFGLPEDRLWRFEFVVAKGEDGMAMAQDKSIRKIVWPYLTHDGARYGLEGQKIEYPQDCVQSLRCRPFTFSARSCNKWALNRVVLCGDAAHVFPPFGGQGIVSGFRDAIALAWRLKLAILRSTNNTRPEFERLFLGWYSERKQSLDRSLASTIVNGSYVTNGNPITVFIRDWSMWFMQLIPSWKHWLELGDRRLGMTRYQFEEGKEMCFLPDMGGGRNFPQIYCRQLGCCDAKTEIHFTDDVIFSPNKRGLFQIVVLLQSLEELDATRRALATVGQHSDSSLVCVEEATFILQQAAEPRGLKLDSTVYRLATASEFEHESSLCEGRPPPHGYDPLRMQQEVDGCRYVVLRPDRFVFAGARTADELDAIMRQLPAV